MRLKVKARRRVPGVMNRNETAYAAHLHTLALAGDIVDFDYEKVTLKLGKDTRYTPDFTVIAKDGTIEMHEVKPGSRKKNKDGTPGNFAPYIMDNARTKINVAVEMFKWMTFKVVFCVKGVWMTKEIEPT